MRSGNVAEDVKKIIFYSKSFGNSFNMQTLLFYEIKKNVIIQVIEKNGIKRKLFYGMSSSTAMKKHKGGVAEYRDDG